MCANDSMALTAMSKLQRMGYNVPEDVIVTGFDNTFNAQNSFPTLTTVERPVYDSGYKACHVLYNLMNGEQQPKSIPMEAEPVFGQSCGCGKHNFEDMIEFKRDVYLRLVRKIIRMQRL